jgi:hypothetical protein
VVADIGYLAHSCDAHVSAPGKQAGDEGGHVRGLPGMAAKDVGESVHEPALTLRKMQHIADIRLRKLIEEGSDSPPRSLPDIPASSVREVRPA